MNILVTGASGQIGREIVELCLYKNINCYHFTSVLDITKKEKIEEFFSQIRKIDIVINCSAYTAVDKAEEEFNEAFSINYVGIKNLALICKRLNIPIIHISTDYVFSGESILPYSEESIPNPLNIYGKSKYEGEKALQKIWHKHVILRTSWIFGKYGNNFVKTILRLATQMESINIVADQKGCPTPADSVAQTLIAIASQIYTGNEKWGLYHFCGFPVTTWYDFAFAIIDSSKEIHKLKIQELRKITTEEYVCKAKRPKNSELLVNKIIDDYGIKAPDWRSSLEKIIPLIQN